MLVLDLLLALVRAPGQEKGIAWLSVVCLGGGVPGLREAGPRLEVVLDQRVRGLARDGRAADAAQPDRSHIPLGRQ
jgi:hypothetical protein